MAVVLGGGAEDLLALGADGVAVAAGEIDVPLEQMILTAAPGKTIDMKAKLLDLAVFLRDEMKNACKGSQGSRQVSQRKVAFK